MYLEGKKIKEIMPVAGTFLLIISVFKQTIYYSNFNIDIFQHIELSEFILLTIPDFIKYGSFLFIISLLSFLLENKEQVEYVENIKEKALNNSSFFFRFKKYFRLFRLLFVSLIFLITTSVLSFFWVKVNFKNLYQFTIILSILLTALILLLEFKYKYKLEFKKKLDPTYANLILITVLMSFYIIANTYEQIRNIEKNNLKISFKDHTNQIKTGNELVYLGMTKNYLFLLNKRKNESIIYNKNTIKNIRIRKD
jgi:hypothetical protein